MKIDWRNGWWRIYRLDGVYLGEYRTVRIQAKAELINTDGNRHGWLIVKGELVDDGDDTATIKG